MDPKTRDDLVLVVAGLIGIVVGHVVRQRATAPEARARARFTGIGTSSLVAAPALARVTGDVLSVPADDLRAQAALSFATGLTLTLFAEDIGRYLPGLPGGSKTDEG